MIWESVSLRILSEKEWRVFIFMIEPEGSLLLCFSNLSQGMYLWFTLYCADFFVILSHSYFVNSILFNQIQCFCWFFVDKESLTAPVKFSDMGLARLVFDKDLVVSNCLGLMGMTEMVRLSLPWMCLMKCRRGISLVRRAV